MKCQYKYRYGDKKCPHNAAKGKKLCIWHLKQDGKEHGAKDLSGLDLDEAYLVGANLRETNLEKCSLLYANLQEANLENANLRDIFAKECNFSKTQMRGVDFSGAFLKYSNFENCVLTNSNLENADLSWVNFKESILTGTILEKTVLLDANLENTILLQARLQGAIMRGAEIIDADLQVANLRKVDLRGANLTGSNIRGSDLRDAKLKYSNLEGVILSNSNLQRADFTKANLKNVLMQGASMQKAIFRECDLEDAALTDTDLESANLRGANLKGVDIDNANLNDADIFNAKIEGIKNLKYARIDDISVNEKLGDEERDKKNYSSAMIKYDESISTYIDLKNYFNTEGLYERSGAYFIREWMVKGKLQHYANKMNKRELKNLRFLRYYLPFSFNRRESGLFPFLVEIESGFKYLTNKLLYFSTRYGESPIRVLATSLFIILFYSILYWATGGITMGGSGFIPSFSESLYFSVVTFTTLGYGDYHPKPDFQLLAISEAFIGAFVLAFFVVVVSRKLIR